MQLQQFYNTATKGSSRKKCYYFWWSTWLLYEYIPGDRIHKVSWIYSHVFASSTIEPAIAPLAQYTEA